MLIRELTAAQCQEVLARAKVARLACSRADQPYVVPISFTYDVSANCVFGFSTIGKKVQWMIHLSTRTCGIAPSICFKKPQSGGFRVGRKRKTGNTTPLFSIAFTSTASPAAARLASEAESTLAS